MNRESPRAWSLTLFMACVWGLTLSVGAAQGVRTVWDGVYTKEQAARGEALAAAQCVACHGDGLTGVEAAPPLTGDLFSSTWEGVPLSDLADRIRTTMPLDKPGTLSRGQAADLLAYMLALSKMPAGTAALPAETVALGQITYRSYPPR